MGASDADESPTAATGHRAEVVVNGEPHPVAAGTTVADLVSRWCRSPEGIAVARNREVVPRSEWATTALAGADVIEIVTAAAGG
jgi:sulfur carrier protein